MGVRHRAGANRDTESGLLPQALQDPITEMRYQRDNSPHSHLLARMFGGRESMVSETLLRHSGHSSSCLFL